MLTAHLLTVSRSIQWGREVSAHPPMQTPQRQIPCPLPEMQTPLDADPLRSFDLWCMLGSHPPNRMTNRCKNITLPQTSFAGGNNLCQSLDI